MLLHKQTNRCNVLENAHGCNRCAYTLTSEDEATGSIRVYGEYRRVGCNRM